MWATWSLSPMEMKKASSLFCNLQWQLFIFLSLHEYLWPGYLVPLQKLECRTPRRLSWDASNPLICTHHVAQACLTQPSIQPGCLIFRIDNSFSWSKPFSTWKKRKPSWIVALEDQVPTRLANLSPSYRHLLLVQFLLVQIKDRCTASGVIAFMHAQATPTSDIWPITSIRNQRKKFCRVDALRASS